MYGLFGKFTVQTGKRDALIDVLLKAAEAMQELEGCYLYVVNSAPDDPDAVWVNEIWRSREDHQASLSHEAVKTLIMEGRPLIAGMGERFEVNPAGGKGLSGM